MSNLSKSIASFFYGIVISTRNTLYNRGILTSKEVDIPTIALGNITVGGTGKTPHSELIINILQKHFNVALLSRGYKRKTKGCLSVEVSNTASQVGDEPLQIKRKFPNIVVVVDANRLRGINYIKQKYKDVDVIILDDAFQHRRLKPSLSILLCDYWRPIYKDKLLPKGDLRDNIKQKRRADIVIITKCPVASTPIDLRVITHDLKLMPYQDLFFSSILYDDLKPMFDNNTAPEAQKIAAIAGVARPDLFFGYIAKKYTKPTTLTFPDHHAFSKKDMTKICKLIDNNDLFITTEKDTMRLLQYPNFTEEQKRKMFYLPIKIIFLKDEQEIFTQYIINHVRKNKRDNNIHTK